MLKATLKNKEESFTSQIKFQEETNAKQKKIIREDL